MAGRFSGPIRHSPRSSFSSGRSVPNLPRTIQSDFSEKRPLRVTTRSMAVSLSKGHDSSLLKLLERIWLTALVRA